jgi:small subunit ribosomal protein S4
LRPGDVITLRDRPAIRNLYQAIMAAGVEGTGIDWVSFDSETLTATVQGNPGPSDISLPVDANTVIEFMSR